jgi:thiamine-monophosphate kinase
MSPGGAGPTGGRGTLGEIGEFALIAEFTQNLARADDVLLGPGDDAAVLDLRGLVVTTVDVLVEGVHFRRDWSDARSVGRKSVAVNVADIEAMGARPRALVVGFSAPADLAVAWALDFADGLQIECAAADVSLVGGDVTRARDITVAVCALGVLEGGRQPVRRDGAKAGNALALVGRTGWAAAGLVVLGRGFRSPRAVVEALRVPEVPYGAGLVAARAGATAMIDVSDGLLADLGHVATASGVVVELHRDAFEVPEPLRAVAAATGSDPYSMILTGGEDHALAATFPTAAAVPEGWRVVGHVRDLGQDEEPRVLVDGAEWAGTPGWDHFRATRR